MNAICVIVVICNMHSAVELDFELQKIKFHGRFRYFTTYSSPVSMMWLVTVCPVRESPSKQNERSRMTSYSRSAFPRSPSSWQCIQDRCSNDDDDDGDDGAILSRPCGDYTYTHTACIASFSVCVCLSVCLYVVHTYCTYIHTHTYIRTPSSSGCCYHRRTRPPVLWPPWRLGT